MFQALLSILVNMALALLALAAFYAIAKFIDCILGIGEDEEEETDKKSI